MKGTRFEEELRSKPQSSFIIGDPSSAKAYLDLRLKEELKSLWNFYDSEKKRIAEEEYQKDYEYYYPDTDGIYPEDYLDHWRIDDLHNEVFRMEDEIYGRYKEYEDALLDKLHRKEDEEAWVCRDLL